MSNTYVYIGRFQIPHLGHEKVMEHAIKKSEHVIILIGSANQPRDKKNPFTYEERKSVLESITARICQEEFLINQRKVKITLLPLDDFNSDQKWTDEVKRLVNHYETQNITITGCRKDGDESTFYLNLFPDWKQDFIKEVNINGFDVISSTKIRDLFFKGMVIPAVISKETDFFLSQFRQSEVYRQFSA